MKGESERGGDAARTKDTSGDSVRLLTGLTGLAVAGSTRGGNRSSEETCMSLSAVLARLSGRRNSRSKLKSRSSCGGTSGKSSWSADIP